MDKLIILEGKKRWILERVLASIFYALIAYVFFIFIKNVPFSFTEKYFIAFVHTLKTSIYLLTAALFFSYTESHHFNLKEKKYRKYYAVGPFGFGNWKSIEKLEYTSVFLNSRDIYEVLIWDESNNRFKVSYHDKKDQAKETAKHLAEKLQLYFYEKDAS